MSKQTEEMRAFIERARAGDLNALERIRTYLQNHAFPLFGEELWPQDERQFVLESDERSIETLEIIIDYIEEAE